LYFAYNSGRVRIPSKAYQFYDTAEFFGGGTSLSATAFQQDTTYHVGLQYALNNPTFRTLISRLTTGLLR